MTTSTLLLGLAQSGVTGRLWSAVNADGHPRPDSFDTSIGYPGVWDVRGTTPDEQSLGFQFVPAGDTRVWLRAPGYVDQPFDCTMPSDSAKELRLLPVRPVRLVSIDSARHRMIDVNGQPVYGRMASAFLLFRRWLDGEDVTPFLRQHQGLGFNMLRVFGMFESLGGFDPRKYPNYFEQLPLFLDTCAYYGFYVYWVACAATSDFLYTDDEVEAFIGNTIDVVQSKPNTLFSPVNEQAENSNSINRQRIFDTYLTHLFGKMLFDTGSFGVDKACDPPFGTHVTLHTIRSYPGMAKDGNIIDHSNHVNDGLDVGIDESYRAGDNGSGDKYWLKERAREASGSAYTALFWTFHSLQGEDAVVLTGNTLECAQWSIDGMRGHR